MGTQKFWLKSKTCHPLWCIFFNISLQWCHNEQNGVSNHRRLDCLLNRSFIRRTKEASNSASPAFVRGIRRRSVNSPRKGPVPRKFDDVIMMIRLSVCVGSVVGSGSITVGMLYTILHLVRYAHICLLCFIVVTLSIILGFLWWCLYTWGLLHRHQDNYIRIIAHDHGIDPGGYKSITHKRDKIKQWGHVTWAPRRLIHRQIFAQDHKAHQWSALLDFREANLPLTDGLS